MKGFYQIWALMVICVGILWDLNAQQEALIKEKPLGDWFVRAYSNDPPTLNPITSNDTVSGAFMDWVMETMARRRFDNPDQLEPILATSWEASKDHLEYTIHLRKGVKWHPAEFPNGEKIPPREFTSADVRFSFEVMMNPAVNASFLRNYYARVKDVEVIDKYTIKVIWKEPYFLSESFSLFIPIIPRHIYSVDQEGEPLSFDFSSEEFGRKFNEHWFNGKLCGTGPYRFVRWDKNTEVVLERNPDYWGKDLPDKMPRFDRLIFKCVPNDNTALLMLKNGDLDRIGLTPIQYLKETDTKAFKEGKLKKESYTYPAYTYIGWNLRKEKFKDKRVRQALTHAIPRDKIIKSILYNLAEVTTGPIYRYSKGYDETLKPYPYDLGKARRLLKEAGWKDTDQDGLLDKIIKGKKQQFKFDLLTFADSLDAQKMAEVIKDSLQRIGIEMTITPVKWNLMLEKVNNWDFDAVTLGWALSWKADPYQLWHSSQADIKHSSNHVGWKNEQTDKLIEEIRSTFDQDKLNQLYKKFHRIIYEHQPYTFLYVRKALHAYDARIHGWRYYPIRPCYNVCDLWVPVALQKYK